MSFKNEDLEDAKALYGLNETWHYDSKLIELYHKHKEMKYECERINDEFVVNIDKKYYLYIKFVFTGNICTVYKNGIDMYDNQICNKDTRISKKLGNSFVRYFAGKSTRLDNIRLQDYFYHHAYYGKPKFFKYVY